jgi:hypothetical protein
VNLGDDGKGNLVLYRASAKTKTPIITVGRVDYDSGTLYIDTLLVDRIPLDQNYISIIVTPKYNDVIAYKNQILLLDDADIKVSAVNLDYVRLS